MQHSAGANRQQSAIVDAVLQVHPTRACNLSCQHCYSMSGPQQRTSLAPELLRQLLSDAGDAGYRRVSFSGGEPLMYRPLRGMLEYAHDQGLSTSVTTNGTLITPANAGWLSELVDVLAVSVDGLPETHNRIRGSDSAFSRTERGLGYLQGAGASFATIFTLTAANLDELPWVAELTATYGGSGVQIHPLESAGNAALTMSGEVPDATELGSALFAALGSGRLHADIADVRLLTRHPQLALGPDPAEVTSLAAAVRPLVLEADGTLVPLTYGFPRRFALGSLLRSRLPSLVEPWLDARYPDLRQVIVDAVAELVANPPHFPFVNWYEYVTRVAERQTRQASLPDPRRRPLALTRNS